MNRTRLFILFLVLTLGMFSALSATVSTYVFSQSMGTYTEITGGTVLGNTASDDQRFLDPAVPLGSTTLNTGVGFPIGFDFTLDGNTFDRFAVNFNGWISLGQSALTPAVNIASTSAYTPLASTSVNTPAYLRTRISGFATDLQGQTGSELSYLTTGAPGSQILTIQWKGVKKYGTTYTGNFNFQILLYEGLNKVEVVYGSFATSYTLTAWYVQAGLGGSVLSPIDYNNRYSTTDWSATTPGAAAGAQINLNSTIYPPSGLTFAWAMPSGPPVLTVSPEDWDFGTVQIYNTATRVFTISNSGGGTITINSVTPAGLYYGITVPPTDLSLAAGESTTFTVSYAPLVDGGPYTGSVTVNYTTDANYDFVIDLTGASIDPTIDGFPYNEGFEGGVLPLGWTLTALPGYTYNWETVTADAVHGAALPYEGLYFSRLYVYLASTLYNPYCLITPPINLSSGNKVLDFWAWIGADGAPAPLDVEISIDNQATWILLYSYDLSNTNAWINNVISLEDYTAVNAFIRFKATSNFGYGFCDLGLDNISILTDGTVPVELSSFAATLTADLFVKLTWISQTETNLTGYRVYRNTSNDQATAEMLDNAWVPATNTSTTQVYNHVDDDVLVGRTYYYWLESVDYASSDFHGPVSVTVENNDTTPVLPTITSMKNAYPNPFRSGGNTNIEIALKAGETGTFTVYNILGQVVRTLNLHEGSTTITWDGSDSRGNSCTSGLYFYKLHTPSVSQTRKLVLVK